VPHVAPDGVRARDPLTNYKHFAPLGLKFPTPLSTTPPSLPSLKVAIKAADNTPCQSSNSA
jgi:hypothetical protein